MFFQVGFFILTFYLGWIYAQVVLIVVLLGALLSRDYRFEPNKVGGGVTALAIGALLAVPLAKAGMFSRSRRRGPRTDSMTFETEFHWSSHMIRRIFFTVTLPLAGLAYTLLSGGQDKNYESDYAWAPILWAGVIGFLSNLAIAECHGLVMETFDLADLQPGVNSKHRLQSLADPVRRRRTNYTSFPRVTAGIMLAQTTGFLLAALATGIGGIMTRSLGAQIATAITAGILLGLTLLFILVLVRFRSVQVIPDHALGTRSGSAMWGNVREMRGSLAEWKPVIVGNPSGKVRRMNLLEIGGQSRWTEIRRLNRLLNSWREDEAKIYRD